MREQVEYRCIDGYPGYLVGDDGSVWTNRNRPEGVRRRMRQATTRWGHRTVTLTRDGRRRTRKVHQLVLAAFVGTRPAGLECRHRNGNPGCNRLWNLAWGTRAENAADMIRHGRHARGERNGNAKLSEAEVLRLIRMAGRGVAPPDLMRIFVVSRSTVGRIVSGRKWSHIERQAA